MKTMISVKNLKKYFGNTKVIRDISLEVEKGEVIAVLGSSGSGKSTFLRCLNLLNEPTDGKIFIDGEELTSKNVNINKFRQKIGMVFQQFNLFSNLSVIDNVKLAPKKVLKMSDKKATQLAKKLLRDVGMIEKIDEFPGNLSGGQKQRVAIARGLAMNPEIMLLDEPTSALDPEMIGEVLEVIKNMAKNGMTMLIVTHEMNFARDVATRVIFLDKGRVIEDQPSKDFFENPKTDRVREFLGKE